MATNNATCLQIETSLEEDAKAAAQYLALATPYVEVLAKHGDLEKVDALLADFAEFKADVSRASFVELRAFVNAILDNTEDTLQFMRDVLVEARAPMTIV